MNLLLQIFGSDEADVSVIIGVTTLKNPTKNETKIYITKKSDKM